MDRAGGAANFSYSIIVGAARISSPTTAARGRVVDSAENGECHATKKDKQEQSKSGE
jgi:hypothetical protein